MPVIIDLILVLIFAGIIYASYKKGFVASFVSILAYFTALIVAMTFSVGLATFTYKNFVKERLVNAVSDKLSDATSFEGALEVFPDYITNAASSFGINSQEIIDKVNSSLAENTQEIKGEVAGEIVDLIASPIAITILRSLFFFALFLICSFVCKFIGKRLSKLISKIPFVGRANALLGALLGVVKGAVVILIICALTNMVLPSIEGSIPLLTQESVDKSLIFDLADKYNPLSFFLGSLMK